MCGAHGRSGLAVSLAESPCASSSRTCRCFWCHREEPVLLTQRFTTTAAPGNRLETSTNYCLELTSDRKDQTLPVSCLPRVFHDIGNTARTGDHEVSRQVLFVDHSALRSRALARGESTGQPGCLCHLALDMKAEGCSS